MARGVFIRVLGTRGCSSSSRSFTSPSWPPRTAACRACPISAPASTAAVRSLFFPWPLHGRVELSAIPPISLMPRLRRGGVKFPPLLLQVLLVLPVAFDCCLLLLLACGSSGSRQCLEQNKPQSLETQSTKSRTANAKALCVVYQGRTSNPTSR